MIMRSSPTDRNYFATANAFYANIGNFVLIAKNLINDKELPKV